MSRPPWITESAILLLTSAILEPLREIADKASLQSLAPSEVIGLLANFAIFATVSWFLWKGHNWARWVTFILCLLCLAEMVGLNTSHGVGKLVSTFYDAGVAVFLLFWLNTRPVRDWFRGRTTSVAPPPAEVGNSTLATHAPRV